MANSNSGNESAAARHIRFSLIIPAYNEELYLPRLLETVSLARSRYHGGAGAIEVIVADNNSTDATAALAQKWNCRVATVEKRVIAAARNGGAQVAQGEVLCFVDADSRIHPDTFNAIDAALAGGKVIGGATGGRFERKSLGIGLTWMMFSPLILILGLDTGVVFCRRDDYDAVGGYNEERLFAEDVQFLMDLKRLGRPRGQRFERVTSAPVILSTRKFDKYGDWHSLKAFLSFPYWHLFSRCSLDGFVKTYWYQDR
jgi:glycosyltransferase involved in cell wall biosynthesis